MTPRTIFWLILAAAGIVFGIVLACFDYHGCPRLWLAKLIGDPLLKDFVKARQRTVQANKLTQKVKTAIKFFVSKISRRH